MAIGNVGPWLVSGVALVQPWLIRVYQRVRATIEIFQSGNIEIGYSALGPTVGLLGTLRAQHRDFFVRAMRCRVRRNADNLTHTLDWNAFRSHKIGGSADAELARSFLLSRDVPYNYNILFNDQVFLATVRAKVEAVYPEWLKFEQERGVASSPPVESEMTEFVGAGNTIEPYAALDRAYYWTAGTYTLDLEVEDERGTVRARRSFTFDLTSDDESRLRTNSFAIVRSVLGFPVSYAFAYPTYKPPTTLTRSRGPG